MDVLKRIRIQREPDSFFSSISIDGTTDLRVSAVDGLSDDALRHYIKRAAGEHNTLAAKHPEEHTPIELPPDDAWLVQGGKIVNIGTGEA